MTQNSCIRYPMIDIIRGIAVIFMIIFHIFYDLKIFGYNNISFQSDPFWFSFPRLIVFLFLISAGLSLPLAHPSKISWHKFWPRFIKIAICASLISLSTYMLFRDRWIYFGTLHCIALVSLVALPFMHHPKTSLALGLFILIPQVFFDFKWWWWSLEHRSMDYIPFLPWFGVTLLAHFFFHLGLHKVPIKNFKGLSIITWSGKHSLTIYLLHQPLIYGTIFLLHKALNH